MRSTADDSTSRPRGVAAILAVGLILMNAPASPGVDRPALDPTTGALKAPKIPDSHRFGVALMAPKYKPLGKVGPNILIEGAEDALKLGFRTIKVGLNSEVASAGWQYYYLSDETLAPVKSTVDLARLDVFKRLFDMPFKTYFLAADAVGEGNWESLRSPAEPGAPRPADRPLTDSAKGQVYRQLHDLTLHLLRTYGGTGKVFILQNHETDWHTIPTTDPALDPSDVAIRNVIDYLSLRQKAVDDARREVGATGVYVYHMAEVNLVAKAMAGGKTVTNDVLPRVACDLVGYSAYETAEKPGGEFLKAFEYLRSKAIDSYAFGANNVIISELGVAERRRPDVGPELKAMLEAITSSSPFVIQWALYDNECSRIEDGEKVVAFDATEEECQGFWVRKPDGGLGKFFRAYQTYLDPVGDEPESIDVGRYVDQLYRLTMGRRPDAAARVNSYRLVETRPWEKEVLVKDIFLSAEYKARTGGSSASFVFDTYRCLLGRFPEPPAVVLLAREFHADADRLAFLDAILKSDESRLRYVSWLYRRYLDREPEPEGLKHWMSILRRGSTRRQVHDQFVSGLPPN